MKTPQNVGKDIAKKLKNWKVRAISTDTTAIE
jgi:hypothetical protein